eukprot:TRINITY_DN79792_c0_g1_i1.p1 TRINITY_DN79792_c0_g1~~TRINITY_DN79792_c0_g1_i1.p1  ORF type:complete len:406 (+),score=65.69 TRINITY_DN79792_c0_g1_i1:94-1311(+)
MAAAKGRAWDIVGIGTVAVLGILGVRRRHEANGYAGEYGGGFQNKFGKNELNLSDAHCIVTGASSGIGAEVAWGLARNGANRVEMACREKSRCEQARADLLSQCLVSSPVDGESSAESLRGAVSARAAHRRSCTDAHQRCFCTHLELTDTASVRRFASETVARATAGNSKRIVLVNNAGIMGTGKGAQKRDDDKEGRSVDIQLWTNHYGHYLLTRLLLPSMSHNSCVAIVASRAHHQGSLSVVSESSGGKLISSESIDGTTGFSIVLEKLGLSWYAQYARSKLCNVLFAAELRRRYPEGPLSVAISPGLVGTALFAGTPQPLRTVLGCVSGKVFQTPSEGAAHVLSAIFAALSCNDLSKASLDESLRACPLYWHCGEPVRPSAAAEDAELSLALWKASEAVVGLE